MSLSHVKHCAQPWLRYIAAGVKKIEGRLDKGIFSDLRAGDEVTWFDAGLRVLTIVREVTKYSSFTEMLQAEGLRNVLPDPCVLTIADGVAIYRQYFTEEEEKKYGVLAIHLV